MDTSDKIPVLNPFDNTEVDTVPRATPDDIDRALAYAVNGAKTMRKISGFKRYEMLMRAAQLMDERIDDLARTITLEEGKILGESRIEVARAAETIRLSAEEAKRIGGEVLPLDGAPNATNQFGFTLQSSVRSRLGHHAIQLPVETWSATRSGRLWPGATRWSLNLPPIRR